MSAMSPETPTQHLDRVVHAAAAQALTGGLSPVSLSLALADWAWHLMLSPGRQMELAALAARLGLDSARVAAGGTSVDEHLGATDDDPRFRHEAWAQWPFSALRHGFRNQELFWREAASMPGMKAQHATETQFFARQWLGMLTPANWLPTNPVVLADALESGGAHLAQGALNWLRDSTGQPDPQALVQAARFVVGRDVAVTPGKVVHRNRLVELIRYAPQTKNVHPEPVFIVSSWIMKYYILDLSPHNSLVRYLVGAGHTVYMVSWLNPDARDQDLSMDDYVGLGVIDPLRAIGRLHGAGQPVHAAGYCLGGTLLAIAAAALGRPGCSASTAGLPALRSLTLIAAQTDFSEPGELGLFIDESQIHLLDEIMRGQGYLTGAQMAGTFQFLHSRELVWTRRMREYLLGEREQRTDLTAWNADTTRMPARMHHEYLTGLYLRNALAAGRWRVDGHVVSLADIRVPVFLVGTEHDHVSPWHSVYQLHRLCDAEVTFVLVAGGHNAGIISEPGHPRRHYRIALRPAQGPWLHAERWEQQAERHDGSWWPAWHAWLAARSGKPMRAAPIPAGATLADAPGTFVLERCAE